MTNKITTYAAVFIVLTGIILLGWAGYGMMFPPPPPYQYKIISAGKTEKYPALKLADFPELHIQQVEMYASGVDKPLAKLFVGQNEDSGPVLMAWANQVNEPVFQIESRMQDTLTLSRAVVKHAPQGATVLSWWDTSRKLQLLGCCKVYFSRHLNQPLFIPEIWKEFEGSLRNAENQFWQTETDDSETEDFMAFVDALASDASAGVRKLRALADNPQTLLVLRLADAYNLGHLRPEQIGIGYRDFSAKADLHNKVRRVKKWLKEQNYDSYSVLTLNDERLRVFFLTDNASGEKLITQLLPFSTSNPATFPGMELIYQTGEYWTYQFPKN